MKATNKAQGIEDVLTALTGKDRASTIGNGECVFCDAQGLTEASFRDTLSIKEYTISGMCQACQDDIWS